MSENSRIQSAATCKNCTKSYDPTKKAIIQSRIGNETSAAALLYPGLCFDCIMQQLRIDKDECLPLLTQAISVFKAISVEYNRADVLKRDLRKTHSDLDTNYQNIKFFLQQQAGDARAKAQAAANKPKTKRAKSAKTSQAALVKALLAGLTPEQRKLIAAQASSMD